MHDTSRKYLSASLVGFASLLLALVCEQAVGEAEYDGKVTTNIYRSSLDGTEQAALFYAPETPDPVPLLVTLHTWSGGFEQTYHRAVADWCIEHGWAFVHPHFRGPNNNPDACGSELAVADVADSVRWMRRRTNIDRSRIYLIGTSGGGHMALLMAGRRPDIWAGVSAWVPITDLTAWHAQSKSANAKYYRDIEGCCGGPPGTSPWVDAQYRRRSPLSYLHRAQGVPVDINAGIRDGHQGSVPISHSLHAFNHLANTEERLTDDQINALVSTASVPEALQDPGLTDPTYGAKQPLFRRTSKRVRITIFDGAHEYIPLAGLKWLAQQQRIHGPDQTTLDCLTGDNRDLVYEYLLTECDQRDAARRKCLADALASPGALRAYQSYLRESYAELLGAFPDRTDLNPRVTGQLKTSAYRVEKVIFESFPQHHVTALVYKPATGDGPWPAVLFACGHSTNGKAAPLYQTACALLAQNGFLVLSYDPISQGERVQLPEAPRHGTTTHTLLNVGARLVGRSVVWYEAWDGIRAIDYLLSRQDVDRSHAIGMTGTSGGGTQTTFLMALDPRIGPAAPSCYIMSRTTKFRSRQGPADGCQHLPGEGRKGIDHIDYAIMRAPKPTAVLAATRDFFDIRSTRRACAEAERVYRVLKATDRFEMFEADNEHGMRLEHRQEATRWMNTWLRNDPQPVVGPDDFETFDEESLWTAPHGQILKDFEERTVADLNLTLAHELKSERKRFSRQSAANQRDTLRRLLAIDQTTLPAVVHVEGHLERSTHSVVRLTLTADDGIPVPGLLFVPQGPTQHAILHVDDAGKSTIAQNTAWLEQQFERGAMILAIDVRGFGETMDRGTATKFYNQSHRITTVALHLGRPLLGQRVQDVLHAVHYLASRQDTPDQIELIGIGHAGPVVLHAAALEPRVSRVSNRGPVQSWVDDVVAHPIRRDMSQHVVPGALRQYDLPDLTRLTNHNTH